MGKLIDMIGKKFNRLTIVSRAANEDTRAAWNCICDCGNNITLNGKQIRSGHTKSCGCIRKETSAIQGHKNKHSVEYVKAKLKENGFELLSEYKGILKQGKFKCLCCNLEFTRRIESSLYGLYGCPSCSKLNNGFMQAETFERKPHLKELDSRLYLMEFDNGTEHFWKLGITRQKIHDRIRKIPYKLISIQTISGKLYEIYKAEKMLKQQNKQHRYRPSKFFNGHTECFSQSINIGWN